MSNRVKLSIHVQTIAYTDKKNSVEKFYLISNCWIWRKWNDVLADTINWS